MSISRQSRARYARIRLFPHNPDAHTAHTLIPPTHMSPANVFVVRIRVSVQALNGTALGDRQLIMRPANNSGSTPGKDTRLGGHGADMLRILRHEW